MLASVVFAGALCGFSYWFSSSGYLAIFLEWVRDIGYWGNLLFVVAFTITGLPFMLIGYTPLGLAAGFIYGQEGPILGTPPLLSRMILGRAGRLAFGLPSFLLRRASCLGVVVVWRRHIERIGHRPDRNDYGLRARVLVLPSAAEGVVSAQDQRESNTPSLYADYGVQRILPDPHHAHGTHSLRCTERSLLCTHPDHTF